MRGLSIAIAAGIAAAAVLSTPAYGAGQRSFVASYGVDPGNLQCSRANPCRSFGAAIGVTTAGGEVVILDTAAYGTVTIAKSIKIIAPAGVYGAVTVFGGVNPTSGIVINASPNDDITLSGLDISGLPGAAPLPLFGIDVQSAGIVHIDHVRVSNFTDPAGACIHAAPTASMQVYVNDNSLRECRAGIDADGTAVSTSGDPLVAVVDNSRIELGRATSGPVYGLWIHGYVGASVRNSLISLQDVDIQIDNLATNVGTNVMLSQSQLVGGAACLNVNSTTAGGVPLVSIAASQFFGCDDGIVISHSAAGTTFGAQLKIADSSFEQLSNNGITLSSGSDAGINMDLVRSQVNFAGNTAVNANASASAGVNVNLRDVTLSNATTLLRTAGTSSIVATLIRSHLHNSVTAVEHGLGLVRLEQTTITGNQNSLVNNGSPSIISAGNNWIVGNADSTPGTVYITTPNIIAPK